MLRTFPVLLFKLVIIFVFCVPTIPGLSFGSHRTGPVPEPNTIFMSGASDLKYCGIYYRNLEAINLTYTNGDYNLEKRLINGWVLTDTNGNVICKASSIYNSSTMVPLSIRFESLEGGPSIPPRMDQTPPPTNLRINFYGCDYTAQMSTNVGGYNSWFLSEHNMLVCFTNALKSDTNRVNDSSVPETGWRVVLWPSEELVYYNTTNSTLPPKRYWKKYDGSDACIEVEGQQLGYISHITQGEDDWTDYLEVDNLNTENATYTIEFFPVGVTPLTSYEIAGGTSALVELKKLAPEATCAKISTSPGVLLRAGYRNNKSGGVAEFFLNDLSASNIGYFFNTFNANASWKGISIMNPGSTTANVSLNAYDSSGLAGTVSTIVAPGTRDVGVTEKWFPTLPESSILRIMAVSDQPILGIVIMGNSDSSQITFTQAMEVVSSEQ